MDPLMRWKELISQMHLGVLDLAVGPLGRWITMRRFSMTRGTVKFLIDVATAVFTVVIAVLIYIIIFITLQ